MTEPTRRNILRYGIAIDLVILATGIAMLLPLSPVVLVAMFTLVVALSVWKGRWQGGLAALALSILVLATEFSLPPRALAALIASSAGAGALVETLVRRRSLTRMRGAQPESAEALVASAPSLAPAEPAETSEPATEVADDTPVAPVLAFRTEPARDQTESPGVPDERKRRAGRKSLEKEQKREAERQRLAREQADREQLAAARAETERRAAAERAERAEAERVAEERAESERVENERRAAAERAEAERVAKERAEAERVENERRAAAERAEAERVAKERAEAERVENERRAAVERAEAERVAKERAEAERVETERRTAAERAEAERVAKERAEAERAENERRTAAERAEAERVAKERAEAERVENERRAAVERAEAERVAKERAEAERAENDRRATAERAEAERIANERVEAERRARAERDAAERIAAQLAEAEQAAARSVAPAGDQRAEGPARAASSVPKRSTPPKPSLFASVASWFRPKVETRTVNVANKRIAGNDTTTSRRTGTGTGARRAQAPRRPRLILFERRRGTADAALPKLRNRAIEVVVVERWIDAADELFRFRPDAMLLDIEHPDFDKAYRTISEKTPKLPLILTGRAGQTALPTDRYAAFVARPYDVDELSKLAHQAMTRKEELLAQQNVSRVPASPKRIAPLALRSESMPGAGAFVPAAKTVETSSPSTGRPHLTLAKPVDPVDPNVYEVACFTCRVEFNAVEADWCSCLAKERSLVCTNCLACFCKAPPAYKEAFWVQAPAKLFERKSAEGRRQQAAIPANPNVENVRRPLLLCVEDDEDIQSIVHRVATNLGYGFVSALNGQEGLESARRYLPNLILSDAFMPKLDGREMCRSLKEDPAFAETRMVIMTGLYTDTKYRSEALKRFHVDDYIAKPVAITDLINLLQRHLEGVSGLPAPEDLHELHRREVDEVGEEDVPLAELLDAPADSPAPIAAPPRPVAVKNTTYDVRCFNCQASFDATHAEWCSCVGRDNTLLCPSCHGCFCKAPAAYKERFWVDAPSTLFERKMIGSKRSTGSRSNPSPSEVKRPLILLVEDDENVQLIVRTVVTSMGFGFVSGANGQEGLVLAREYNPDLILSDAFMPKLDGREMCRLLKEDPETARAKTIIMTGLYTDRKYRNEALNYFKADDYVAKPLAVDDLIKLFKKHLPQEIAALGIGGR